MLPAVSSIVFAMRSAAAGPATESLVGSDADFASVVDPEGVRRGVLRTVMKGLLERSKVCHAPDPTRRAREADGLLVTVILTLVLVPMTIRTSAHPQMAPVSSLWWSDDERSDHR